MDMFTPEEIRALRKELALSGSEFAKLLGVGENTVRRWELGDRHPRWEMMKRMNELRDEHRANGKEARRKAAVAK